MWTQSSTNALTTRPTRTPARVMDSGTCTHAAPSHEDTSTDWDDIQARLGNAKPKPKPPKPGKLEVAFDVENRDADARQADDADVDFEADDDDDEYVREYRARRLAEMHAASNAITYGEVIDTTRERFVADVTEPSSSGYVVVCMTRKGCPDCDKMERAIAALARKHQRTKFVRVAHRDCVPNYPDRLTPTLLVYKNKDVARTFATLAPFGGSHMTPEGVEFALNEVSSEICPSAFDEDESAREVRRTEYIAGVVKRTVEAQRREREMDDDDDDDDDD